MAGKKTKEQKKKWDFSVGAPKMTKEEADVEVKRFFEAIEEQYKNVPEAEIRRGAKKIQSFIDGKINWAELFNFTPEMLFNIAEYGFTQFKSGRFAEAERVFKILTVLDWTNAYYHSVMGSILQRQKRYGEAIAEYTQAIELDSNDVVSLTNRGEIFLQHGLFDEAREDFVKSIALDSRGGDRFANRARLLLQRIEKAEKEGLKKKKGAGE